MTKLPTNYGKEAQKTTSTSRQLKICQRNQGIFIYQTNYIREMLKIFGMKDCKLVTTPMQTSCKLGKDDDSKSTD